MRTALLVASAVIQFLALQGMFEALGTDLDWADLVWAMSLMTTAVAAVILAIQKH